jgi:hypothetical protein
MRFKKVLLSIADKFHIRLNRKASMMPHRSLVLHFAIATVFLLGLAGRADASTIKIDSTCPAPTMKLGAQCVIAEDLVLASTLELAPDTRLNCQGHKITPVIRGVLGDASTRSTPELAIVLLGATGVQIQNCRIEGFDFGILALNSKVPADIASTSTLRPGLSNKIWQNTISVRFVGIDLISVDNTDIKDNNISWFTLGGAGVFVQRDSDFVTVKNNLITGDFTAAVQGARLVPGPTGPSNPVLSVNGAVVVAQMLGPHPTLLNAVVEGVLYQISTTANAEVNEDFPADVIVEGNAITFPQANQSFAADDGIVSTASLRTIIRGNVIGSCRVGIRDGGILTRQFPGVCKKDSNRLCVADSDCFIPNIDSVSKGQCVLQPTQNVNWVSKNLLDERNTISGPFLAGISSSGENVIIQNNNVTGPLRTGGIGGIRLLGGDALETAVVTRNTVSGVTNALALDATFGIVVRPPRFFGAQISLNDFVGYTTAVRTSNDYLFPSELSLQGRGNYWGLSCAAGGFDRSKVRFQNGAINPNVIDSHPYGESIAGILLQNLPATCY